MLILPSVRYRGRFRFRVGFSVTVMVVQLAIALICSCVIRNCVRTVSLYSRTFFIVNTAFSMASSRDFYRSFHNILNPTVTYIGRVGLEYVGSSDKLSDLC